jgi:hypothetical protein
MWSEGKQLSGSLDEPRKPGPTTGDLVDLRSSNRAQEHEARDCPDRFATGMPVYAES